MTTLQQFLAYPLHPQSWNRPAGSRDYRITNPFDGKDFINGGLHGAVDVGNFRSGDPITAPVSCMARGITHTDGAIGLFFDLGGGWQLELWHLQTRLLDTEWQQVQLGQQVGATGSSGQVNGAHTHIELKLSGKKQNPEPYLPMAERPAQPIPGATAGQTFVDVPPSHPFYNDIEYCYREGLIYGVETIKGRAFFPDMAVTNERLAAIIARVHRDTG